MKKMNNWREIFSDHHEASPPNSRSKEEQANMEKAGYVEVEEYRKKSKKEYVGYFCSTCEYFKPKPNVIDQDPSEQDGNCPKIESRVRAFGCCNLWEKKM